MTSHNEPPSDGWTTIARSKRSKKSRAKTKVRKDTPVSLLPSVDPALTLTRLASNFADMEKQWAKSRCARQLEELLSKRSWNVDRAIGLGIGSFSRDWAHRYRSLWQLCLFRWVVSILQSQTPSSPIPLYITEPFLTPLDCLFLAGLTPPITPLPISSIPSPESYITSSAFLFAPFVDWPVLLLTYLRNKHPQLYIGNSVETTYRTISGSGEDDDEPREEAARLAGEIGRDFREGRTAVELGEFEEHGQALLGIWIYWREEDKKTTDDQQRNDTADEEIGKALNKLSIG